MGKIPPGLLHILYIVPSLFTVRKVTLQALQACFPTAAHRNKAAVTPFCSLVANYNMVLTLQKETTLRNFTGNKTLNVRV